MNNSSWRLQEREALFDHVPSGIAGITRSEGRDRMQGTVDGFSYGLVTPVAAYLMACLGGALGLRCTTRSVRNRRSFKPGWLALGATAIGSGIWTMHFVAMMGFTVAEAPISYDRTTTFASLAVAIVMVSTTADVETKTLFLK